MMRTRRFLLALAAGFMLSMAAAWAADNNSIAVNTTAKLGGTNFGLDVFIDDDADDDNSPFVASHHPNAETHMSVIWRMDLGGVNSPQTLGSLRQFRFMTWHTGEQGEPTHLVFFAQRQDTTGNWRLAVWSYKPSNSQFEYAGGTYLAPYNTAQDIRVKCEWTQATTGMTGLLKCWKADGLAAFSVSPQINTTTLDNDNALIGSVRFGYLDFDGFPQVGIGPSHLYLDEYESYR